MNYKSKKVMLLIIVVLLIVIPAGIFINKNLSKSTYESLGMGEYYNLKSLMSLSQGITKYNQNNSAFSIAKAGISMSNFTIKV